MLKTFNLLFIVISFDLYNDQKYAGIAVLKAPDQTFITDFVIFNGDCTGSWIFYLVTSNKRNPGNPSPFPIKFIPSRVKKSRKSATPGHAKMSNN